MPRQFKVIELSGVRHKLLLGLVVLIALLFTSIAMDLVHRKETMSIGRHRGRQLAAPLPHHLACGSAPGGLQGYDFELAMELLQGCEMGALQAV
jgi:hypothetical protein